MTFFVDYLTRTTALLKEAFTLKKYKAMPIVLAIFTGLIELPFFLLTLPLLLTLYVCGFIFKVISTIIEHLHDVVRRAGGEVKHATQFIIYFLSWGFIFFLYVLASALLLVLTVSYALAALLTYVWTLGGFKFHFFADESEELSTEVQSTYHVLLPLILLLGAILLLVIVPLVCTLIEILPMYIGDITVEKVLDVFLLGVGKMKNFHLLFTLLYTAIVLCPHPKAAAIEKENDTEA